MAGKGPTPKPPEQRRRQNTPAAGEWIRLSEPYSGPIPPLPKNIGISKVTRDWWKEIWRTPMATQWNQGDIPALIELAILRERLVVDGKVSVASEVRLRSEQFGLTPSGRQQRRWIITEEDAERAAGAPKRTPTRRGNLRVVDSA